MYVILLYVTECSDVLHSNLHQHNCTLISVSIHGRQSKYISLIPSYTWSFFVAHWFQFLLNRGTLIDLRHYRWIYFCFLKLLWTFQNCSQNLKSNFVFTPVRKWTYYGITHGRQSVWWSGSRLTASRHNFATLDWMTKNFLALSMSRTSSIFFLYRSSLVKN